MKDIVVSIIIPTYSRNEALVRAIDSALAQTYENIEILVVDDNSPDSDWRRSTESLMETYRENGKVRYIQNEKNLGGAEARNEGIRKARGEYIAFLDDDDEYYPAKVEKQLSKFLKSENDKLALVYCDAEYLKTDGGASGYIDRVRLSGNCLYEAIRKNCVAETSRWMCRKECLDAVGGFPDVPSKQDSQMILRLLRAGYELDFVPEILSKYYMPGAILGSNISTSPKKVLGEQLYYEACKECFVLFSPKQVKEIEFVFAQSFYEHHAFLENHGEEKQSRRKMLSLKPVAGLAYLGKRALRKLKHKITR